MFCDFNLCFRESSTETSFHMGPFYRLHPTLQKNTGIYSALTSSGIVRPDDVGPERREKMGRGGTKRVCMHVELLRLLITCRGKALIKGLSSSDAANTKLLSAFNWVGALMRGRGIKRMTSDEGKDKKSEHSRKQSHYTKNIKEQSLESISEE